MPLRLPGHTAGHMGGACSSASSVNVLDNIEVKAELKTCKLEEFEKGEVLGNTVENASVMYVHLPPAYFTPSCSAPFTRCRSPRGSPAGKGHFGEVHKVVHSPTGILCAMKTVKRRKPKSKLSDQENRKRAEKDKLESRILVPAPLCHVPCQHHHDMRRPP